MDVRIVPQVEKRETLPIGNMNGLFTVRMFHFSGRDLLIPFFFKGRLLNDGVFAFVVGRTLTLGWRHERKVWCEEERSKTKWRKERKGFHEKRKMRIMKREKSLG